MSTTQWSSAVAVVLRTRLPAAAEQIVGAIGAEIPAYAGPIPARAAVEQALAHFGNVIENPDAVADPAWRAVIAGLGASAFGAGRSLETLLAAYRVGARHAWREISDAGHAAGVEPTELYRLAEELFLYIDELSAISAEGYAAEQAEAAGERHRLRSALADLLVREPPPEQAEIADAAQAAGWRLPATVAVLALDGGDPERLAGRIAPGALAAGDATIVIPDPDAPGRPSATARIAAAAGVAAALGPTVAAADASISADRARRTLALVGDPDRIAIAGDHLVTLLLHSDERLLADLRERALAPLASSKLTDTLHEFLRHQGRMDPTARALGVHPQTVRYRVARLRELLGGALDDPDRRLELQLALTPRPGRQAGRES